MASAGLYCVVLAGAICLTFGAQVVTRPPADDSPVTSKPRKVLESLMSPERIPEAEKDAAFWRDSALDTIRRKLETRVNVNRARNGIFFIGDGMSLATVMAARTFAGQLAAAPGEETRLAFEEFPVSGLAKTYCIDAQVPDSACTATAYLTGVKTKYGTIGLDGNVTRGFCPSQLHKKNWVHSIASWALKHGLDTGFVTTTRVTHASPAGTYAHSAERDWESDADLPAEAAALGCRDIAKQLVLDKPGNMFKVIMGGGLREFLPNRTRDASARGRRLDGTDLTELWHADKIASNHSHSYITDKQGLLKILNKNVSEMPEYVLGLFNDDHMDYHLKSDPSQPTLEQMTELAIKMLSRNPRGYFLFVEGGRIDHAHHENLAHLALDETVEYARAVRRADRLTSPQDTLIVVSSDHAHTMTVAGYPSRGNDILGAVDTEIGEDNLPYTTISYANGKGYYSSVRNSSRFDVTMDQNFTRRDVSYQYPATVPLDSETHGGEDVAVWARGPWQHLFTATYEQSALPHLVAFAMCIAEERHDACHTRARVYISAAGGAAPSALVLSVAMAVILVLSLLRSARC